VGGLGSGDLSRQGRFEQHQIGEIDDIATRLSRRVISAAQAPDLPFKLKLLQTAQEEMRMMLKLLAGRQTHRGQPIEQHIERDASFSAGQRRANTKMDAKAKCHVVTGVSAVDIKAISVDKAGVIAVGRGVKQFQMGAAWNADAADFKVCQRGAKQSLHRRVEAQGFLDRILPEPAILNSQSRHTACSQCA
jgi:hypothetical protein